MKRDRQHLFGHRRDPDFSSRQNPARNDVPQGNRRPRLSFFLCTCQTAAGQSPRTFLPRPGSSPNRKTKVQSHTLRASLHTPLSPGPKPKAKKSAKRHTPLLSREVRVSSSARKPDRKSPLNAARRRSNPYRQTNQHCQTQFLRKRRNGRRASPGLGISAVHPQGGVLPDPLR